MSVQTTRQLRITKVTKHTPDVWSFFMVSREGERPDFKAGQVAILEMNEQKSYFAFASAPEDPELEFLVKRTEKPGLAQSLFDSPIEKTIHLQEIVGRGFPVEGYADHDFIFVAMGTGLAPLRSALRHVFADRARYGRLFVLYGVRGVDDFCYQDEMSTEWKAQGVDLRQVISRPGDATWSGPTGYVQSLLDNVMPDLSDPVALICGSKDMMDQTRTRLVEMGINASKVLTNY
jgi:NAD(P)H-flavin reductase